MPEWNETKDTEAIHALRTAMKRLEHWLPSSADAMLDAYLQNADTYDGIRYEKEGYRYCLFSFPLVHEDGTKEEPLDLQKKTVLEEVVLLVLNENDEIIADTAAMHLKVKDFLNREDLYAQISDDSDWSYLAYYILAGTMFEELPFPFCTLKEHDRNAYLEKNPGLACGEILFHTNAYVTSAYRGQHIFPKMLQMMKDHALRKCTDDTVLYCTFSLDPDVACYGPDSRKEPYYYSFEKDEPVRMHNAEILKHLGYEVLRLEEDNPQEAGDGTKLWFAIRRERDIFVE